jgi:hypothetical protein
MERFACKHPNLDHDIQQWEVNETAFSEGVEKETRNMLKKMRTKSRTVEVVA